MKRNLSTLLLISLVFLSLWQMPDGVSAQQKLTLAQILTGLQTKGKTAETNTLPKRNVYITRRVRQLGVTFRLTSEIESELRNAGATDELIEAIRQNAPSLPPSRPVTPGSGREIKNSLGMEFVKIPAGSFIMGSPVTEKSRGKDEVQHQVKISRDFYMAKYEVTQAQWEAIMGSNPSDFKECDDCPVEQVSWNEVQEFIKKLNARNEGKYRLPTEAEWEYAARAGTTTVFSFGNSLNSDQANFDASLPFGPYGTNLEGVYLEKTLKVGSYQPNAWGLYDMHGNVYEWCQDWYGAYPTRAVTDPTGAAKGTKRVIRGGCWKVYGRYLRSAFRNPHFPTYSNHILGFRLVRQN